MDILNQNIHHNLEPEGITTVIDNDLDNTGQSDYATTGLDPEDN